MKLLQNHNSKDYTRYSAYLIILFSIIILILASMYHVSGDGCWHLSAAKFIGNKQKIPLSEPLGREEPFWSPPLYHFIASSVYYAFSIFSREAANFAVKFVSPIFGILALIFSFLTIKKLFNSKIAFYSTLFLASTPMFMDYSVFSYVESTLVFFVVLSIYFMANGRIALSGIAAGLSILAKYNGAFVLPVLIFMLYRRQGNIKHFYRNAAIIVTLSLLVASPWLLRNWILLGNPVWPFLNFIFKGHEAKSFSGLDIGNIADPDLYAFTYLGFFGVPDGNYRNLSFIDVPYFESLFVLWLIGTFIFMMPLIIGILNSKNIQKRFRDSGFIIALLLSYLALFFMYAANVGFSVSRMLLPAFPAFAVLWALGYERIAKGAFRKIAFLLVAAAITGFVLTEFAKMKIAADSWNSYNDDFEWVRKNTNKESVFIAEGQCVQYNMERTSLYATEENLMKADYVWTNQNFRLDRRSILTEEKLGMVHSKNYGVAYFNKDTGTLIYGKNSSKNI